MRHGPAALRTAGAIAAVLGVLLGVGSAAAAAPPIPLAPGAPWPEMRHDARGTGLSPVAGRYHGDRPWQLRTGRGIFSTPIIGADGTVYVGSGDRSFYAIAPGGGLRWRIETGGLIDAAGALGAGSAVTFGSGDDRLYHVILGSRGRHRIAWRFRASVPPVPGQKVDWWEGNVAVGPGGTLYAGNTGGTIYALSGAGRLEHTYTAGNSVWTAPAFAPDGSSFWGSLDFHAFRLGPELRPLWQAAAPGYFVSSPALGSDGAVYIGAFDSYLYALDPRTGAVRWRFAASDHIYSSPALAAGPGGATTAIYIASADGSVYALSPGGRLRWRYDTGDAIRSSPALGRTPDGRGLILYIGSSNGKLFALDGATGRRRWSFDTTLADPALRDRNDLNASPALGTSGVVIAGEDGFVDYVPYDWCRHHADRRCDTRPGEDLSGDLARFLPVTSGGTTLGTDRLADASPATILNLRLIVRRRGRTVNAAVLDPAGTVHIRPRVPVAVQESGDGHFLFVRPLGLLRPRTRYRIALSARYTDNGQAMGNFDPHGRVAGTVRQTIIVRTANPGRQLRLNVGALRVDAFTFSRAAVPMPGFLPSVNQIGFDSYDWIASTVARRAGRALVWFQSATRDRRGREQVDPRGSFHFAMAGSPAGGAIALASARVALEFSFGEVPLQRFEMRGTLAAGPRFRPGASLYAETVCATVPHYGAELHFTGICNPTGLLAASGTFLSASYAGPAARRPAGVGLGGLRLTPATAATPGSIVVGLRGRGLPSARAHSAAILICNGRSLAPADLDLAHLTTVVAGADGRIAGVRVRLPAGSHLPAHAVAYVILDAFPLARAVLAAPGTGKP